MQGIEVPGYIELESGTFVRTDAATDEQIHEYIVRLRREAEWGTSALEFYVVVRNQGLERRV